MLALVCALLLGIGQFTKNALPSYSALENMAKTNKMLQAFKQGDSETLRGMMPDGVYIEGAGIAMPGTENTAGSLHQPMLVVEGIDPDSAGHVTVAYLVYTQEAPAPQTTSDKIWLMQRWLQDGEMRYRFKGFGYEDGVYYAEYALSFLDADGNAVHKASLWAKWDGDHVVSLHLKVDSAALITLSVVEVQPDS